MAVKKKFAAVLVTMASTDVLEYLRAFTNVVPITQLHKSMIPKKTILI